jgi:ribosomal protein L44E
LFFRRYAAAMSTKHVRTAADLVRFKTALKIECAKCGNSRTLSGFDVVKVCGTQDLRRVQHRFKCSLCGATEASLTVLSPPASRN